MAECVLPVFRPDVDPEVGGLDLPVFGDLPGIGHGAVQDAVPGVDPHLVSGIGGGIDPPDRCDHQGAVASDRADHEPDLIRVACQQHPERRGRIDGGRHVAELVDRHQVGPSLHIIVDLLFKLRFVSGYGTGGQKIKQEFPVHFFLRWIMMV